MKPEPRGLAALAAQVEHYRLIFRWPERTASLLFPGLLILSVAIHTFAFFIFQVVYPPTVASAPPRAQVTLLTPGTPHSDALLRWVEAQDPATAGRIQEIAPKGLEEIRYTPSYEAARMPPRIDFGLQPARCKLFQETHDCGIRQPVRCLVARVFRTAPRAGICHASPTSRDHHQKQRQPAPHRFFSGDR